MWFVWKTSTKQICKILTHTYLQDDWSKIDELRWIEVVTYVLCTSMTVKTIFKSYVWRPLKVCIWYILSYDISFAAKSVSKFWATQFYSKNIGEGHIGSENGCRIQKNRFQEHIRSANVSKFAIYTKKHQKSPIFPDHSGKIFNFIQIFFRSKVYV